MTMTASYFLLAGLALLAALHPYTSFPLSLWLMKRLGWHNPAIEFTADLTTNRAADEQPNSASQDLPSTPPLAILMCVHNEEDVIEGRMSNLIALADQVHGTEILVYVDGSTDATESRLHQFGERIRVFVSVEQTGKTPGMNLLVQQTTAPIIVFTDAAVRMSAQALPNMLRYFNDATVGCVCGHIVAVSATADSELTATADTSIRYWAFDAKLRQLESEVASVMGAHGPLFAIRRELHEPPPAELFDDFWVSMAILYAGHRVVQADDFVGKKAIASKQSDEFTRKTRIACQSFNIHRALLPRLRQQSALIRYCYFSHKTLRWMTIFSLTLFALFASLGAVSAGWTLIVIAGWVVFALDIALGLAGIKPLDRLVSALAALIANGRGVIQSLRGTSYQTWSPVKSARQAQR